MTTQIELTEKQIQFLRALLDYAMEEYICADVIDAGLVDKDGYVEDRDKYLAFLDTMPSALN